jgi:hypothetical protein
MARPVVVTLPHSLGRAEARARVDAHLGQFKAQLANAGLGKVAHAWNADGDRLGFSAKTLGQTIQGSLEVLEDAVRIEVMLPGLLAGFAETVAGRLQRDGPALLEKK